MSLPIKLHKADNQHSLLLGRMIRRMNDACFMMKETVFFGKIEVLLDNQVSRRIFKNSDLLSDIQYENPFFIGGIDGTSRGLKKIHGVRKYTVYAII